MDGRLKFGMWIFASWLGVFFAAINIAALIPKPTFEGEVWKVVLGLVLAFANACFAHDSTKDRT